MSLEVGERAMRAILPTLLVFVSILGETSFVRAAEVAVDADLARLQGRWVTRAGPRKKMLVTLIVEGNKVLVDIRTPQGMTFHAKGEIRVNSATNPRSLDWVGFTGLDSQDLPEIPAIYQISGESFTVCNGGANNSRPSEFKAGESILADLHVFERVKPAP